MVGVFIMEKEKFKLGPILLIEKLPIIRKETPLARDRYEYIHKGIFKCFCARTFIARIKDVTRKHTKSCGCLARSGTRRIDGRSRTRLYKILRGVIDRTSNPNGSCFGKYGARGIHICEEWRNFDVFKKWALENGYNDSLSLDRKDGSKGYYPENCRWATPQQQSRNTCKNPNSTSRYKGVSFVKDKKKPWRAEITINYKKINLGYFHTQEEAALSYNQKAFIIFREFAVLNVIDSEYPDKT